MVTPVGAEGAALLRPASTQADLQLVSIFDPQLAAAGHAAKLRGYGADRCQRGLAARQLRQLGGRKLGGAALRAAPERDLRIDRANHDLDEDVFAVAVEAHELVAGALE